ncbi:MAG: formimidoylglutamate deiminase [Nitrospirales bacterium]|nr:MAG: formimidoylglutamate deiminase [Nitrospirales bacterium]
MTIVTAKEALLATGWAQNVEIEIDNAGRIAAVRPDAPSAKNATQIILPAFSNLHSHAFQRAMAGLTEARGRDGQDSFWTWRTLMYRFLDHLGPDDIEAITAFAQMEMLEAGYASVAEFHYIHHGPGGGRYDDASELSTRIMAAAGKTGIGLTLLPVLYERGGCDNRPLAGGQKRFAHNIDTFAKLVDDARNSASMLDDDAVVGVAAHSLRAVHAESLYPLARLAGAAPIHIHIAEQMAEVEEVKAAYGKRPVEWLFDHHEINEQWCLVHATQMKSHETKSLATSGAIAGICPITEANLGDGIFDGAEFLHQGGRYGVGTDSNVRISLTEELRLLEYSQRLKSHARAVMASDKKSTGRVLFEEAASSGAQAAGRESGSVEVGKFADLIALDGRSHYLADRSGDTILDSYIFAGDDRLVTDVWSAGRHMVTGGRHKHREAIVLRYRETMAGLMQKF